MTDKNSKKNFKSKVIAKLFGEHDEDNQDEDVALSADSSEEDIVAAISSLIDSKIQARGVPFHEVHCSLTGQKQKSSNSNTIVNVPSESDSCDGESGKDVVSRKRRRHRKGHHKSHKTDQEVMSSVSGALQTGENLLNTNDSLPVTNSSLTKNQKRKLKKKRKEKEKRSQSSSIIEFTFESSGEASSKIQTCHN
ncbi:hypothetical protein BsWGS_20132 [Bradybaena similaris]